MLFFPERNISGLVDKGVWSISDWINESWWDWVIVRVVRLVAMPAVEAVKVLACIGSDTNTRVALGVLVPIE